MNEKEHINTCKECSNKDTSVCKECSNNYANHFVPIAIPEGYCQCICCKKILPKKVMFSYILNPKYGLCFNCY